MIYVFNPEFIDKNEWDLKIKVELYFLQNSLGGVCHLTV